MFSELLMNPGYDAAGTADTVAAPAPPSMDDLVVHLNDEFKEDLLPTIVPKPEHLGEPASADGLKNLNAEPYLPPEPPRRKPVQTLGEINARKRELLRKFARRARGKGCGPTRAFTMDDPLEDMEEEEAAMRGDDKFAFGVDMLQSTTVSIAATAEKLSSEFPRFGINLKDFSRNVKDQMDEFYPIFEELYEKYEAVFGVGPELRLLYMFCMIGYTTHSLNKMETEYGPSAGDVMRENPALAREFVEKMAEKTMRNMHAGVNPTGRAMPAPPPGSGPVTNAAPARPALDPLAELAKFANFGGPPAPVAPPASAPKRREIRGPDPSLLASLDIAPPKAPVPASPKSTASKSGKKSVTISL